MTALRPPDAIPGQRVVGEPQRLRHEIGWPIELADGRRAVLAQLAPELAAEPVLRRRWVADMQRVAALAVPELAPTLRIGPAPDPRALDAEAPWRVRLDPPGDTLEHILARAPLPIDELVDLASRIAGALQHFHDAGAVLRDLDPRHVVVGEQLWFTDIGQARLAILSSRTASSLLVESSPYVAPEALLQVVVDARADVYSLGVVMWRGITGGFPFEASLITERAALPPLSAPADLARLIKRCLEREPEQRPATARDVADALGGRGPSTALVVGDTGARAPCQACGAPMRVGLRLCLNCGKEAVQFRRARSDDPDATAIVLTKAVEDAAFAGKLRALFESIAVEIPKLNFVIGDPRMYDKTELARRHKLPTKLVEGLAPETAIALVKRMEADGFRVQTTTPRKLARERKGARRITIMSVASIVGGAVAVVVGGSVLVLGGAGFALGLAGLIYGGVASHRVSTDEKRRPIGQLRDTPAALPASDPLVAKIATALAASNADDVRARLEEIALLVQRCVDARAALADAEAALDLDLATTPVLPLVDLACTTTETIGAIDRQLGSLDEAAILRALARCEARNEAPELRLDLLEGLDKLRELEEQRTRLFGRILEITSLTRSAVELGLRRSAASRSADAEVSRALAALEADLGS